MKKSDLALPALVLAAFVFLESSAESDNAISEVVDKLQEMLSDSKTQGKTERDIFAKFKCYCDTNDQEKSATIKRLGQEIAEGDAKIKTLRSDNERLGVNIATLEQHMSQHEKDQNFAESMRSNQHNAFVSEEGDLTLAIESMGQAIKTLEVIKGSALQQSAGDKFTLSTVSYSNVEKELTRALEAASSMMAPEQYEEVQAFLQLRGDPEKKKKGSIIDILKKTKETMEKNLENCQSAEAEALAAHQSFLKNKKELHKADKEQKEAKESVESDNSGSISSASTELEGDTTEKSDTEDLLVDLRSTCEKRTIDYENRKHMRLNEQAALTKALSILDSDEAFAGFNKVQGRKDDAAASFLQLNESNSDAQARTTTQHLLRKLAKRTVTPGRLNLIAGLLQTGNPFEKVTAAIDKMENDVKAEQRADEAQLAFCKKANETNDQSLENLAGKISDYEDTIGSLRGTITTETTTIDEKTISLHELEAQMATATNDRNEEKAAFTASDADMEKGIATMDKALKTLAAYYDKAAETPSMLQKKDEPETWEEGTYQSQDGGGVIDMLQKVRDDMKKEKDDAIKSEDDSKSTFDTSMATMESDAKTLREDIARVSSSRAENKISLQDTIKVTNRTQDQVVAVKRYAVKIKPQCDFIEENFDMRSAARTTELEGLGDARKELMESDEYKQAVAN